MMAPLAAGAAVGLGVFLLVRLLLRPAPSVAVLVARLDTGRSQPLTGSALPVEGAGLLARGHRSLARRMEEEAAVRGWQFAWLRADLDIMGRSLGGLLATKLSLAVAGFLWIPVLAFAASSFGLPVPFTAPMVLAVAAGGIGFVLPDAALRQSAAGRRKDFRHVVGCFLDLVAMNLAGGRGLPEALMAASSVGDHWALLRIRQALANSRLVGSTPWEGLAALGTNVGVDELRDMAGALALAADDGAKIRASLTARAATLRRRELSDAEGQAGERSQSMLVAQLLIAASFLVFLVYPALTRIVSS